MRIARLVLMMIVAGAIWLPALHLVYGYAPPARRALTAQLAERATGAPKPAVDAMRAVNPEWDFMARTFTVLGLANRALAAETAQPLGAIDAILDDTLATERAAGQAHFLLPYARREAFRDPEGASVFIDGEIVMMIAARDVIAPRRDLDAEATARAARIARAMERGPARSAESYPNECWTFCNTTALAGLAMLDRARGRDDHAALASAWVAFAKEHLTDPATGVLVSSFTYDGRTLDGPEGSSIWMVAQNLLFVDDAFARDQYARARRELGATVLGFGYAREWPASAAGKPNARPDVDSGPIVPLFDASAGSSGMAILGASAFGDDAWLDALLASLDLAAYPDGRGDFHAMNDVGRAVLLDALTFGPLLARTRPELAAQTSQASAP